MKNYNSKFKILPHIADLKIQAFGGNNKELFSNTLLAMTENMKPKIQIPIKKTKRKTKIKSLDLPSLLVDFLSEVLYLTQVNKEIYKDVKFTKFSDKEIEAEILGQKVERFGEDIKAVTHHDLEINQKKDGKLEATVLFDI